jgi:hypothetical protein
MTHREEPANRTRRARERRYRAEQRSGWGRDDFKRGIEFERFEALTRKLVNVPKKEVDEKRDESA